ncbi:HAMP domain-containing protein [Nocardioides sp. MAH-18]|uniref:histidine kinase n=1 Tax=Nocardioides agri TaxID=2682843 RepID=A0A6L6XUW2_9ACTN|nr:MULTISPECIES: HAMP domain-containing sensor histidine kinase [unclassified Nocardioides]MBA2956144.1 HAMP domain-containing histidine kinase [Nocardioides sp. CGMCC 1.13656]MVQ50990.1 HAMP domain-containing protein [Nocardioides sp. MAH-18]
MTLRQRILLLAVGAASAVMLLFAIPLWLLLDGAATEEGRENAADVARGVADYVSTGSTDVQTLSAYVDRINDRGDRATVTVLLPDGTQLGADLPGDAPTDVEEGAPHDGDGDQDDEGLMPVSEPEVHEVDDGQLVSVHASTADGPVTVLAFATAGDAHDRMVDRLLLLAAAAAVLLLLAAGAAEIVVRRLVRDLDDAAAVADRLAEGDLSARAPEDGVASEVRRVSAALNRLAGRIGDLLAAERETVADLSHRLRTPLTAVRLDVEALPSSERTDELESHLDHLERTLTAVIRAARRPEREGVRPRCDAVAVLRERVDFWWPLAEDQGRELEVNSPDGALMVRCAEDDLRAAVDALMENCIAHTSEGVPLSVELTGPASATDLVRLEIRDRGPGIPAGAGLRGRSDRGSTGLGLDIARTCAEASGGRLEFERRDGWTVVRLFLGTD